MGEYMPIGSQRHAVVSATSVESGASDGLLEQVELEEGQDNRMENLQREVLELRRRESTHLFRLNEAKSFWENKVKSLSQEVEDIRSKAQARELELKQLQTPPHELKNIPGPRCLHWVVGLGFSSVVVLIILANLAVMFTQHFYSHELGLYREEFFWANNFFLGFYVLEILLKFMALRCSLLCGPLFTVCWNWLDLLVILVGVVEQWAVPLAMAYGYLDKETASACVALRAARLFRLVRVLKGCHSCVTADFSWVAGHRFEIFMMCVIGFNSFTIAIQEDYHGLLCWYYINLVLLLIYVFELLVKLAHWGCKYFCHENDWAWNWLDMIIVLGGVIDQCTEPLLSLYTHCVDVHIKGAQHFARKSTGGRATKFMMVLRLARLLRILRLVRLVRSVGALYTLVLGIVQAFQGMIWVIILTVLFLYIWAVMGVVMVGPHGLVFGQAAPLDVGQIFNSVPDSMYVLFKVMNGDLGDLEPLFEVMPISKVFIVAFMVISSWAILSILTAVVSENMINATEKHRAEMEEGNEAEKQLRSSMKLEEIFGAADENHSDSLTQQEFTNMLSNSNRLDELEEACDLSKKDLEHIFDLLSTPEVQDNGDVTLAIKRGDFVEGLKKESLSVTERAVMRLEKKLHHIERDVAVVERKVHAEHTAMVDFRGALQDRLQALEESTRLGPALQRLEQRLGASESAAAAGAHAAAEQAGEVQATMARLEQRLVENVAAAERAQAAAEAAQQAVETLQQRSAPSDGAFLAGASSLLEKEPAPGLGLSLVPGDGDAFADEDLLGPELQAPQGSSLLTWEVKTMLEGPEDPPLPVPQPRFAPFGSRSRPAGTGEDERSGGDDGPVDPLDHLLN